MTGLPEGQLRSAGADAQLGHFRAPDSPPQASPDSVSFRPPSRMLPTLFLEVEQLPHQFDHRGGFRLARRRLQRADGRVHDLVDDTTRERFDRQFLFGASVPNGRAPGQFPPGEWFPRWSCRETMVGTTSRVCRRA